MTSSRTNDTALAGRLRALLAAKKMSGRQLATAAGLSVPTCARVLRGDRDLTVTELHAIATALDVSPGDLLETRQGSAA